jgi:hypothetical protein
MPWPSTTILEVMISFITLTANPQWPQITSALLFDQKPPDCPDLVVWVFLL